ncbi:LPS translocon maturation chaperone LptM [Allorhizobium taibaishanense]|nr:lipoprotein [Allorhizobium taibaishanense]MBB4009290.1 putative small lipoprotein YifL [Allorhizobium taibaishanense]
MTISYRRLMISAALLGAVSVATAGCGRKGDLDKPSTPVAQQNKADAPTQSKTPDKKFFLDPLL